jgi:hypothetical protein
MYNTASIQDQRSLIRQHQTKRSRHIADIQGFEVGIENQDSFHGTPMVRIIAPQD